MRTRTLSILAGLALWGVACDGDDDEGEQGADATSQADGAGSSGAASETDSSGGSGGAACPDVIVDGSFEEGPLTVGWMTGTINWETPICNASCFAGANQAFEGDWWVWFGGVPVPESAFVSQSIPIVMGTAELVFHLRIIAETPSAADTLTVLIDDATVFSVSSQDVEEYASWTEVRVDVSDFADGSVHLLSFDANFDGMSTSSYFLDAVELRSCAP